MSLKMAPEERTIDLMSARSSSEEENEKIVLVVQTILQEMKKNGMKVDDVDQNWVESHLEKKMELAKVAVDNGRISRTMLKYCDTR